MEKAYDPKGLLAELKGQGLEVAEESAKVVITSVINWLEASAKLSATPIDDVLAVLYPTLRSYALAQAEGINKGDNV
jgi:hypothetical protein